MTKNYCCKFYYLIGIMLVIYCDAWAIDQFKISLEQVSTSGKTLFINKGSSEDVQENEYAILVKKFADKNNNKEFFFKPIAKLRAVRVTSNQSMWIAYEIFEARELDTLTENLFLFTESAFTRGRKNHLSTKRTKLITKDGSTKEVKDFLLEGDSLARKNKKYAVTDTPHEKQVHFDKEIDMVDVDKWEKGMGANKLVAQGIYKSPYAKDFVKRKRVHRFEKMVVAFLNKYNDPNFNYDAFYKEQERSEISDDLQNKSIFDNVMKKYNENLKNRSAKEEKFLENINLKGDAWSEDYSDEELSEVLNKMSIVTERDRRRKLLAFKYNYQLFASMNFNLINNENNQSASKTTSENKMDFDFAWEGYLFKTFQSLKYFTLEISLRRAQDGFYGGEKNVESTEYSSAFHINWYPYQLPSAVGVNIPYVGLMYRYGFSKLKITTDSEVGNYQVTGFPGVRGGIKYNFRSSFGLRVTGSFEKLKAERVTRNVDDGALPDRAYYVDGKFGIGISKFF